MPGRRFCPADEAPRKFRRALRLAGWNALLLIVGAALVVWLLGKRTCG